MKKAEIIIAAISVLALGLDLFLIPGAGLMSIQALTALSVFYFLFSIGLLNGMKFPGIFKRESYRTVGPLGIIAAVGTGYFLSMTVIGILFKFQTYPGSTYVLSAGLAGLLVFTIIAAIKYAKDRYKGFINILVRAMIIGLFGLFLVLIPRTALLEMKFRNYPEYLEALKKATADPDNKALQDTVEIERQKKENARR